MSAAVTSATRTPTIPHGNLTDTYHSVLVLSDSKVKYNSQRYHDPFKGICYISLPSDSERNVDNITIRLHVHYTLHLRNTLELFVLLSHFESCK